MNRILRISLMLACFLSVVVLSLAPAEEAAAPHQALVKPRPHGPAKGLAGVGLTAEQVNKAIDNGCEGLWKAIKAANAADQKTFGQDSLHPLCALALVHGGYARKNPEFNKALRDYLAAVEPAKLEEHQTYNCGVLCMLIRDYGDSAFTPKLREASRYLFEGEGSRGLWTYKPDIPEEIWARPPLESPPAGATTRPWKRMSEWQDGNNGDNSVSQYALLGLEAATRAGLRFDPETWKRALAQIRKAQCADGGWNYDEPTSGDAYGSMTCSGLCAVAICRDQLADPDPGNDAAIERGLGWLDSHFSIEENPNGSGWQYYYLYSLERAGRLLDTEFIGPQEWYPLGARYLVDHQETDGTWVAAGAEADVRLSTSFALLFLTRATETLKHAKPPRSGPGVLETAAVPANNRLYIILDASGSMIEMMGGKTKFDIAREAIRGLADRLPGDSQLALRVYGHRKTALDEGADEDTELKIPMAPLDKRQLGQTLDSLRSRGKTPLALSLQQARADLGEGDGAGAPVTVVLLTDGGEDTLNPRGNPVKAATDFGTLPHLAFHIVGFDINQPDWGQQLQKMATASHGRYWPAANADDLQAAIRNAILGAPEGYTLTDDQSRPVARGKFGTPQTLAPGHYRLATQFAGQEYAYDVQINAGESTTVEFDPGHLPAAAPGGPSTQNAKTRAPAGADGPAAKFCTHCGQALAVGAKFCPHCGQKVESH